MTNLVDSNKIPSLSYAYTAGAAYRYSKVLGSLTLGGCDSVRFTQSSLTFTFASDDSRPLQVRARSIVAINTLSGTVGLLQKPTFMTIDSTLPYLLLPAAACDAFASAFGLVYDDSTELYLVNDTIHDKLVELNPTLTIALGTSLYDVVNATQPSELHNAAFDLEASYRVYLNATRYFPICRAVDET